jgi:hypothetical protein
MAGRYPSDNDGDTAESLNQGHPWPVCSANFAQLYCGGRPYDRPAAIPSLSETSVEAHMRPSQVA